MSFIEYKDYKPTISDQIESALFEKGLMPDQAEKAVQMLRVSSDLPPALWDKPVSAVSADRFGSLMSEGNTKAVIVVMQENAAHMASRFTTGENAGVVPDVIPAKAQAPALPVRSYQGPVFYPPARAPAPPR